MAARALLVLAALAAVASAQTSEFPVRQCCHGLSAMITVVVQWKTKSDAGYALAPQTGCIVCSPDCGPPHIRHDV